VAQEFEWEWQEENKLSKEEAIVKDRREEESEFYGTHKQSDLISDHVQTVSTVGA
jgi:hypothetical protein